jgi:hypothetical protein
MKRPVLPALLATIVIANSAAAQLPRPPTGGANRFPFPAPPQELLQHFLGTWNLTWDDPADRSCPCHGVLRIDVEPDGTLKGYWSMKGATLVLRGEVAVDQNVWVGTYDQPGDTADFPLKGHFRLEARGGTTLTGSYQRSGTVIPYRWGAVRP